MNLEEAFAWCEEKQASIRFVQGGVCLRLYQVPDEVYGVDLIFAVERAARLLKKAEASNA